MDTWPTVTIVICTYNRPSEFIQTFDALVENLQYPNLRWHIADDGTPGGVGEFIALIADHYHADVIEDEQGRWVVTSKVSYSSTDREGWGVNVNKALTQVGQMGIGDFVYFTEDDYVLKKPLDLRPYVAILETYPQVGMVRFGISGHDGIRARLRELDVSSSLPGYSEQVGQGSTAPGKVNAWELELGHQADWGQFGFFRYSNRPHLKHRRFHEAYGPYQEGKMLAETEQAFNHTIEAVYRNSGGASPAIIVPCAWTYWYYDHIGVSRQGTEEDVHDG